MVVTRSPENVCRFIIEGMNRSATIWEAKGAYTHHDEYVVLTVLSIHQAVLLRSHLRKTDPHAFILVTSSSGACHWHASTDLTESKTRQVARRSRDG